MHQLVNKIFRNDRRISYAKVFEGLDLILTTNELATNRLQEPRQRAEMGPFQTHAQL